MIKNLFKIRTYTHTNNDLELNSNYLFGVIALVVPGTCTKENRGKEMKEKRSNIFAVWDRRTYVRSFVRIRKWVRRRSSCT